jgi:methylenetetrahydrofolate reductase (NADPH)
MSTPFEIVCEIEPATRPDLQRVRLQIGTLSAVADAFLVPDNHIGRATVSSVAVAHEVGAMGARAIACLNARDRNVLGLRRDLLTAAAYGVDEFLFVYGDRPTAGARVEQLTVKDMIREVRTFETGKDFRVGVTTGLRPFSTWKKEADFCFVQIGFDVDALARWRDTLEFAGKVYAGVIVLASPSMARKLSSDLHDVTVPEAMLDRLEREPRGGVELACDLVDTIRDRGGFDGVHLVPVGRYRETAALLESRARP